MKGSKGVYEAQRFGSGEANQNARYWPNWDKMTSKSRAEDMTDGELHVHMYFCEGEFIKRWTMTKNLSRTITRGASLICL